jgi:exodeoxyribonuclease VII small subunit
LPRPLRLCNVLSCNLWSIVTLARELKPGPGGDPPASPSVDRPADAPDFEKALAELEGLVTRLESGDLPLDEALQTFERGVVLTRHCQTALKAAQQKVEILLKRSGEAGVEPFAIAEDDSTAGVP